MKTLSYEMARVVLSSAPHGGFLFIRAVDAFLFASVRYCTGTVDMDGSHALADSVCARVDKHLANTDNIYNRVVR